ncbi:223e8a0b-86bd-44b7-b3d1-d02170a21dec [Thermothielavioides terrestris]|uniref:223e8a0b-86bd-44b7-b3d1-d02170a21dec n=1 Tax=Thermothielavioides terrestris TaxID=2587410 RepID=A0A446BVC1_9PEZI|nr:223e8a0b-86bd-44b7-b3d1-d02170a21dec [Thermothielavioides terrestris]
MSSHPECRSDITLPTFEALQDAHQPVRPSAAALRLHWTLTSPPETAILIMPDITYDPDAPLWPYFSPDGTPSTPSLAHAPLTDPAVSSITLDFHRAHGEPGPPPAAAENENSVFGSLADYDPASDEEPDAEFGTHLLRCCGGDRPRKKKARLTVRGTGGGGGGGGGGGDGGSGESGEGFVTVHDYVTAVHPWLMGLRADLLAAGGDLLDHVPLAEDTRLMVVGSRPQSLRVLPESEWRRWRGKRPVASSVPAREQGTWRQRMLGSDKDGGLRW